MGDVSHTAAWLLFGEVMILFHPCHIVMFYFASFGSSCSGVCFFRQLWLVTFLQWQQAKLSL